MTKSNTSATVPTAPAGVPEISLTDTAAAIITADVAAFKADGKRYAAYVADMSVTAETVALHVDMFRTAFKATKSTRYESRVIDGETVRYVFTDAEYAAKVAAYATKVRNGLNYQVGKASPKTESTKYATALALKDQDRAAAIAKFTAEYDAANKPA